MYSIRTSNDCMTIVGDRFVDNQGNVRHLTAIPSFPPEDQTMLEDAFNKSAETNWSKCAAHKNPAIRLAVALHGKYLEKLSKDTNDKVRNCANELRQFIPTTH